MGTLERSGHSAAARSIVERVAIWSADRAARLGEPLLRRARARPRAALGCATACVVVLVLMLPTGFARRAPVFAAVQFSVDQLGVRLVEGHAAAIQRAARESGVSPTLLAAIVYAESRGRGGQISSAGALGLGQLALPAAHDAARRLGLPAPSAAEVRDDDELNLRLAAAHVAWLLEHSAGWPIEKVLVSYNAGRTRMFQWLERAGGFEAWVRAEERRAAAGEPVTGSLEYARQVVAIRERFRARGKIVDP